jgi:hypothetical protein
MKHYSFLISIIMICISACEKTQMPVNDHDSINLDSVRLGSFIKNNYYNDARLLYTYEIYHDSTHFNRKNPIIDTSEITKVLKILQLIYDLNSPETNTIFNTYKIHARLCIGFNYIYLKVKTDQPEIINLAKGTIPTGNTHLDALLTNYGFDSVRTFYSYPGFPWLTIYSANDYNLIPIADKFSKISSIILTDIESGGCIGDGNTIKLIRSGTSAKVTFSIGDGDCPAGCIYHKYWEFLVENNKAAFVKSFED